MYYRFMFDKRSPRWDKDPDLNFALLSAIDQMCEVKFAKMGTLLLDDVLDELGIPHISHHCTGWHEGINKYEMNIVKTIAVAEGCKKGYVKGYEIIFNCVDVFPTSNYPSDITLDLQFIKNKMALRGARIDELKTMEDLMNKYFPKGLFK